MSGQLILFNLTFLFIMAALLIWRRKELPSTQKEEDIYSREFWLFIGALVLTVACIQMIATTSIPVFNALFGTKVAPPIDPIAHFNQFQGAFAVVILLVTGFTQFLKYKKTEPKRFWAATLATFVVALILAAVVVYTTKLYSNLMYILITFTGIYCILVNLRILGDAIKGKWRLTGSAVSHIGFALLVLGALIAA